MKTWEAEEVELSALQNRRLMGFSAEQLIEVRRFLRLKGFENPSPAELREIFNGCLSDA